MTTRIEGPTPSGGAYAIATWYQHGLEVDDPTDADAVEIVEYDADDASLLRTYSRELSEGTDTPEIGGVVEFDSDSADLLKFGTWDLYIDGILITTLKQYLLGLGVDQASVKVQRNAVAETLELPSCQAAPAELKAEVYAWLDSIGAL